MRWNNKGHEFEILATELAYKWNISKDFYLFGAGGRGRFYKKIMKEFGLYSGFIDNDPNKWCNEVYSLSDFLNNNDCGWIILCAGYDYVREMLSQLKKMNIDEKRFFVYDDTLFFEMILPVLSVYELGKTYDRLCQISVTERCTLKCEKCAHGCWNVPMDRADMKLEDVIKSADYYFAAFDYVIEFVLIGGEPFLYKNLSESIEYIGERYRNQILTFAITTNGTILPSDEIIEACQKYDVHIHISNYVRTLPKLKRSYERLCSMLDENEISYDLSNEDEKWMDYGFDSLIRSDTENLVDVFDHCKTPCREIRGSKYYFCVQARAVSENMRFNVGAEDYLNLSEINDKEGKKALMEFGMGYSAKGYLDMCKYCYGAEAANRIIPRSVQKIVG